MTIFNASKYSNGIIRSPYNDNSFYFRRVETNFEDSKKYLVHSYIYALQLKSDIRTFRRAKELLPNQSDSQDFLVLDIACPIENKLKICDFFAKYKHILMESENGLRGILFTNLKKYQITPTYSEIYHKIKHLGLLNKDCVSPIGYFAPLPKDILFSENSSGIEYSPVNHYNFEELKTYTIQSDNLIDACKEYFNKDGFVFDGSKYLKNGQIFKWSERYPWIMFCDEPAYNKNIFKKIQLKRNLEIFKNINIEPDFADYPINAKSLELEHYQNICDDFVENGGGIAIKSYMGSNKSEALEYLIQRIKSIKKSKKKILFITSRITLANEFKKKFKLPLYSDFKVKQFKYTGSLICQYDSLIKINPKNYDVVIIDEYVSVLFHSTDNLSEYKNALVRKLLELFKKDLVISDAFLNKELLKIPGKKFKIISNEARDTIPIIEYSKDDFYAKMIQCLENKEQISVSTNSIIEIRKLISKICSNYGKTSVEVTGPKTGEYKESTFDSLSKKQYKADIIVYSPALSLGVSIYNKIKNHFHLDTGRSTDTIQSIQMLRRARKAQTIHYCVYETISYEPIDFDILKNKLENNADCNNSWALDFNADSFENKVSAVGNYYIKVQCFKNLLKINTRESFNEFLKYNFCNVKQLP